MNHGAEDDRRDQHFDQLDEAVTERFQRTPAFRKAIADADADKNRDENLNVEDAIPGFARDGCSHGVMSVAG